MTANHAVSDENLIRSSETLQFGPGIDHATRLASELCGPISVLDCGCGDAQWGRMLSLHGIAHHYTGLDLDQAVMIRGREQYGVDRLVNADIGRLPFRNCAFDMVVAYDVLYQFEDAIPILRELFRVSRRTTLLELHLAPFGANSLKMRMWSSERYTPLPNMQHLYDLFEDMGVRQPDQAIHWEVPGNYFKYRGLPYRLRALLVWDHEAAGEQNGCC